MVATDLAEALARAGTPFHQAHQIVGRLVLESVSSGKKPVGLDRGRAGALRAGVHRRIWPRCSTRSRACRSREIAGGTGPDAVAAALAEARSAAEPDDDAMTKTYRQGQILKLIRAKRISTQEELAQELRSQGIAATQVTLSRDIRDLRLVKTARWLPGDGCPKRPARSSRLLAAEFLQDVLRAQNLVVLKTSPGHANSVAVALDREELARSRGHHRRRRHHPGDRPRQRHRRGRAGEAGPVARKELSRSRSTGARAPGPAAPSAPAREWPQLQV